MMDSFFVSWAFVVSVVITIGAGCYSYLYLPMQMRRAYRQSLLTLSRVVETKDAGLLGHGERVAEYVIAVAKRMGVPLRERHKMEYAALLQDIGNVRVPYDLLNKTTELTQEEFERVASHTIIGAEMADTVAFLHDIAPIIRHHHEAWDGSGYPDGLRGDEIPLGARILAVCTAYDSMIHARAYRPEIDEEAAIREIRSAAGTRYDPQVVDTFLKLLKRRHRNAERIT